MRSSLGVLVLMTVAAAVPASAHHSFAVFFDDRTIIEITGNVTDFRFTNPHAIISLEVKNHKGQIEQWKAETNAVTVLKRRGWTRDSLRAGGDDHSTAGLSRDGAQLHADADDQETADGTVLGTRRCRTSARTDAMRWLNSRPAVARLVSAAPASSGGAAGSTTTATRPNHGGLLGRRPGLPRRGKRPARSAAAEHRPAHRRRRAGARRGHVRRPQGEAGRAGRGDEVEAGRRDDARPGLPAAVARLHDAGPVSDGDRPGDRAHRDAAGVL